MSTQTILTVPSIPPIEGWLHNRISKSYINLMLNSLILKNKHICHIRTFNDITCKNAVTVQRHLDAQEHIWKTSGTTLDWTLGLMQGPFYSTIDLHKQHNSDVIIMMSQLSASPFRWEKPLCMCGIVMLIHLCICRHPWPTPQMSLHELLS